MPRRWKIALLLFFLSALNYVDRQTLSVLAPSLNGPLGIDARRYSYLVSAFLIAYAAGNLFSGWLVDRWGVRRATFVAVLAWSVADAAHGWATSWLLLACGRGVLGLAESFSTPAGTKAIAEWIPDRERGFCLALFSNGYSVGAMVAAPLVAWLGLSFGWRMAFVATGLLGGLYLLAWMKGYHSPGPEDRSLTAPLAAPDAEPEAPTRIGLATAFVVVRFLTDSFSYFITFWLPSYLQDARGMSLRQVGIWAWIPFLAAGVGGMGGGAWSDWLVRRGWSPARARRGVMLYVALVMPLSWAAVEARSVVVAIALVSVLLGAQSCWNSNLLALMSDLFPRRTLGRVVSIAVSGGAVGGLITTLFAGRVIAERGYVPVFASLGFLHLTAFVLLAAAIHLCIAHLPQRSGLRYSS